MNDINIYDEFSKHYDRFVNWESRLAAELPFLISVFKESQEQAGENFSIFDAACGTGQHAIALTKAGFKSTGADISEEMVEIARENAEQEGLNMTFRQAGFGQFAQTFGENRFDGLICLGNSLPHLLDEISVANALADFTHVLKPGGKLILQNRNFDQVLVERARWMPPQTYREGDETWVFARFYDFDVDGRLTFNIQILHSKGESAFDQKVISTRLWPMKKALLEALLLAAGFVNLRFFGNLEGDHFEAANSGNLVITTQTH